MDFAAVDQEIDIALEKGVFPGVVVLVGRADTVLYRRAAGWRSLEPMRTPTHAGVIYDVASLTKPFATTAALMLLMKANELQLDDRVSRFLPGFGVHGKHMITLRQVLSHSSGLAAWRHYYKDVNGPCETREYVYEQVFNEQLESPPGQKAVYSDLGFMLLGAVVEKVSGLKLDQYCEEKIFRPLGLHNTAFINLKERRWRGVEPPAKWFAPTERCHWRKRVLCAEVHDDNAYAMGGVAGHAGLFSTVDDLHRLVSCLIACYPGTLFSPLSVGHLGFTGTSVWIDLEKNIHVIILSNRVHPSRQNEKIKAFRPALHNAVMQAVQRRKSEESESRSQQERDSNK